MNRIREESKDFRASGKVSRKVSSTSNTPLAVLVVNSSRLFFSFSFWEALGMGLAGVAGVLAGVLEAAPIASVNAYRFTGVLFLLTTMGESANANNWPLDKYLFVPPSAFMA